MDRLNDERRKTANLPPVKPCEVFDLIGGTSTGGLIAIMLGRLEMDVDECIIAYSELAEVVFGAKLSSFPFNLKGKIKSRFDSAKLEKAVQKVVQRSVPETDLFNDGTERGCRSFVCTADRDTKDIVRLRSYSLSHEPNIRATICQAALATSAATTFFDPASIGDRTFADGGLGANNPVDEVEGEASNIWCSETGDLKPLVKCFLSIGTGIPEMKAFEDSMIKFLSQTVVDIATETQNTEKKFIARWAKHFDEKRYYRFDVDRGLQSVGLDEYKKKGPIEAATEGYLNHIERKFRVRDCIQNLKLKQNRVTINLLDLVTEYNVQRIVELHIRQDILKTATDLSAELLNIRMFTEEETATLRLLDLRTSEELLFRAAAAGYDQKISVILDTIDIVPDCKDERGRTPLSVAAAQGHSAAVRLLLSRDTRGMNSVDNLNRTPLFYAAQRGEKKIVLILNQSQVSADIGDSNHHSPLSVAVQEGHEDIVRLLLLRNDVKVNSKDKYGRTPLSFAAEGGNMSMVKILLDHGCDINIADRNGYSPLWYGLEKKHEVVVKFLLHENANAAGINLPNAIRLLDIQQTQMTVLETLLNQGADIDDIDSYHRKTALHWAAEQGLVDMVDLLLKYKANPLIQDKYGETPLHYAAYHGQLRVVEKLVYRCRDLSLKNNRGFTPMDLARERQQNSIVKLLEDIVREDNAAQTKSQETLSRLGQNTSPKRGTW